MFLVGIGEYSSAQHLLEGEAGALQLFAREASALQLFAVLPLELSSASRPFISASRVNGLLQSV